MKYYLAPMMGYSDCYLRCIAENLYNENITTFSEMIVDKAIIYNEAKTLEKHFLKTNRSAIQIAGSDPKEIKESIQKLNQIEYIKHLNFNLGCPSSRVQENKLGLALTKEPLLVKKCLQSVTHYKNEISVKCRLGLGIEEDIDYIFSYLSLFSNLGIKTIFIHCRNGVLNLDTKKNRTIPTINYELFLRCKDKFPDLNLIPNGEINTKSTFDFFVNHGVTHFMIGRQFAKDILFPEKIGLYQIKDKKTAILKSINEFNSHKFFNLNLIKKSIFTLLNDIPNSKNIRKEITIMEDINSLQNYFESNELWN